MPDTAGETRTKSPVTFSYGPLHMELPVLDDQEEPAYNSSVWTQDVDQKTSWERRMIETIS